MSETDPTQTDATPRQGDEAWSAIPDPLYEARKGGAALARAGVIGISGTIAALGDGVSDWQVGDRVIAGIGAGGLREQVVVQAARLI